jgi:hypothetical protein
VILTVPFLYGVDMRTMTLWMHSVWRDALFRAALALTLVVALILVAMLATLPAEILN